MNSFIHSFNQSFIHSFIQSSRPGLKTLCFHKKHSWFSVGPSSPDFGPTTCHVFFSVPCKSRDLRCTTWCSRTSQGDNECGNVYDGVDLLFEHVVRLLLCYEPLYCHWLTDSLTDGLTDWLTDRLADLLTDWLTDWRPSDRINIK